MIGRPTHLLCCILFIVAYGQTAKSDTLCVADAIIVPADSFHRPIRNVKPSFPEYTDFTVSKPNGEKISVVLFNVKGDSIFTKCFPNVLPNKYILSFLGVNCPGVYFVRLVTSDQTFTRSVTLLQSSTPSLKYQAQVGSGPTAVDGVWEKSYTQSVFPSISLPEERPIPDTITNLIVLHLFQHIYEIEWHTVWQSHGMRTEKYKGQFLVNADTIKLLDPESDRVYQFHINSNSLSLDIFRKPNEPYAVPFLNPNSPTLIIQGTYRRIELEK